MNKIIDEIKLVVPDESLKDKAIEYKQEHFNYGEKIIDGSELWDQMDSYEEWLTMIRKNTHEQTVAPDWVVTDTFFAVRERDNMIIGVIDLRHTRNEFLKDFGNIGYSVRPTERRKGYATRMLQLVLERANTIGIQDVILSCKASNTGSKKTILKNGGQYQRSFEFEGEEAKVFKVILVKGH